MFALVPLPREEGQTQERRAGVGIPLWAWREAVSGPAHFAMRPYGGVLMVVPIGGVTVAVTKMDVLAS